MELNVERNVEESELYPSVWAEYLPHLSHGTGPGARTPLLTLMTDSVAGFILTSTHLKVSKINLLQMMESFNVLWLWLRLIVRLNTVDKLWVQFQIVFETPQLEAGEILVIRFKKDQGIFGVR